MKQMYDHWSDNYEASTLQVLVGLLPMQVEVQVLSEP